MSRARLGLYVFARVSLFQNCFELTPAFEQLTKRPTSLQLVLNETHSSTRLNSVKPVEVAEMQDMTQIANYVYSFYMEKVKQMKEYYEQAQKKWTKPGACEVKPHEYFVSSHPGEDRDTDSEDEAESVKKQQVPVPIQDEPIEEEVELVGNADEEMEERRDEEVRDTGEVENDE